MLNYIKAELFKACRRKYTWILLSVLMLLISVFALLTGIRQEFSDMVTAMTVTMPVGMFLVAFVGDIICSDQLKNGALKHEVAFGISRAKIYLGKLCAAVLLALALCALVFLVYLGGGRLYTADTKPADTAANLAVLAYVTAASLPLWLGALGLFQMLCFLLRGSAAAAVIYFTGLLMGEITYEVINWSRTMLPFMEGLQELFLTTRFQVYNGALTWDIMAQNWCIGLGWLASATVIGLLLFQHREMK